MSQTKSYEVRYWALSFGCKLPAGAKLAILDGVYEHIMISVTWHYQNTYVKCIQLPVIEI